MTGIQTKLLTGTVIVIHSEKAVKNNENIKNLQKSSEVAPLDGKSPNLAN